MRPGERPLDEFGLPLLASIVAYDAPDGGVWIAFVEQRPIADEIEGKPDNRVVQFVLLDRERRYALGEMLVSGQSFGPMPAVGG